MKLTETNAFVGYNAIPQLDLGATVRSTFRKMSDRQTGAVIISSGDRPHWFVSGDWLKPAYEKMNRDEIAGKDPAAFAAGANIAELPIGTFLGHLKTQPAMVGPALPVTSTVESVTRYGGNPLFPVQDPTHRWIGWYFYQGELLNSLLGKAPVFYCERGHPNPDMDNGFCYDCPAPIRQ
ncbi:hypothetical protein [Nitratireductor sp. XY-223]|uniref:hypothetical protein n=1 Tax=Nitratireductor sp. XY-223 TaxID=2561926 RepID=UPI0010AAD9D8|nr:hypothetical protein [Nitratireductor sp. XY-223]